MYVETLIALQNADGTEAVYEVGADVEPYTETTYQVGEPTVSAAGCLLKEAWLTDHKLLAPGWSDVVEEQLIQEYLTAVDGLAYDLGDRD